MMFQTHPQSLPLSCFSLLIILIILLLAPSLSLGASPRNDAPRVRGMFVFGSSILDNGNNNHLANFFARADYSPYGIDFPNGTSGRFTNGRNMGDVLGEKVMIPGFIPPFHDPSTNGSRILQGVNYASGGSGILDATGKLTGNVESLNEQIRNFEKVTLPDLEQQMGSHSNRSLLLSQYLFLVGSGGNDYLSYFLEFTHNKVTAEEFTDNLIATLSYQLQKLYSLGARKFVVLAINPNGCSPSAKARDPTTVGCVENLNRALQWFNDNLRNLVLQIKPQLPAANLVFVNAYKIIRDIIASPASQGFRYNRTSCCELSLLSGGAGCRRGGRVCPNRSEYVFFDGLHTTEAVNTVVATKAFSSTLQDEVFPFNVGRLSQL